MIWLGDGIEGETRTDTSTMIMPFHQRRHYRDHYRDKYEDNNYLPQDNPKAFTQSAKLENGSLNHRGFANAKTCTKI
jgi:hypothetical protein